MPVPQPVVPEDRLEADGWTRIDSDERVLADLAIVTVHGHTVVYGDERLRETVEAATDPPCDRPWRFVFATRLALSPSPPGDTVPSMVAGIVRSRARNGFADRLRERGFTDVSRGRTEEIRVRSGERASLTGYQATDTIECGGRTVELPVEGWVGIWHHEGVFHVAGGAYPIVNLGEALGIDVETDPGSFRTELFELIRKVGYEDS